MITSFVVRRVRVAAAVSLGLIASLAVGPVSDARTASTTIAEIQGAAQLSPVNGSDVSDVTGIVTARKNNGFYLQDPRGTDAPGYVAGASSAVFVFTGGAPAADLVPGTSVSIAGKVNEYRPGASGLTLTELTNPAVTVVATDQPLPAAALVGPGGLTVPPKVIDNDAAGGAPINVETDGTFDPAEDGIDFWESLEFIRVKLVDARVVGPTNTSYGETPIVPAGSGLRSARGGIILRSNDPNPERIILDDALVSVPAANVGDTYGTTVGVVDYGFGNFSLEATTPPTLHSAGLQRESVRSAANAELSVASFNVENLAPSNPQDKFDRLAAIVVGNLASPDLLALEEVQDNSGSVDDGTVAADQTLRRLVDAISATGGPTYTWRQIDPVNDAEGGQPGGNIRVAFLIRRGTPLTFVERAPGDSTTPTDITTIDGAAALTHSPGRITPGNPAWNSSRVPLVGEFMFGDQRLFVIANHWNSKGGDEPLFGPEQPPAQPSTVQRAAQAQQVRDFVDRTFAVSPDAKVVVLGDLNDFPYANAVRILRGTGTQRLLDLPATLPRPQRYTYVYAGNSQVLDHVLLSRGLVAQGYDYDIVHVNAEFNDQVSDHDPQVVDLHLGLPASSATIMLGRRTIAYGRSTVVSGRLTETAGGRPLAGATVRLQCRPTASVPWSWTGARGSTSAGGRYKFRISPGRNTSYRVRFGGDRGHAATVSSPVRLKVSPRVSLVVSDRTVTPGTTVAFFGVVRPDHAGQYVDVQRRSALRWRTVATVRLDRDSSYVYRRTPRSPDVSRWRVLKRFDGDHARATSRVAVIRVRKSRACSAGHRLARRRTLRP